MLCDLICNSNQSAMSAINLTSIEVQLQQIEDGIKRVQEEEVEAQEEEEEEVRYLEVDCRV